MSPYGRKFLCHSDCKKSRTTPTDRVTVFIFHSDSVPCVGVAGQKYYAVVIFFAKNSSGSIPLIYNIDHNCEMSI